MVFISEVTAEEVVMINGASEVNEKSQKKIHKVINDY